MFLVLLFTSPLSAQDTVSIALSADTVRSARVLLSADSVVADGALEGVAVVRVEDSLGLTPQASNRWYAFCDSLSMPWVAFASVVLPGSGQVINRDYWKIPVFYSLIGGFTALGTHFTLEHRKFLHSPAPDDFAASLLRDDKIFSLRVYRNMSIAAAVACYSLSVADALITRSPQAQSPFAAMMASALFPGLGQIYNRSYWKVPIIYTGAIAMSSNIYRSGRLVKRFDAALVALLDDDPATVDEFGGKRSREDLEYFRDYYQRNRDLNVILLSLLYVMNVIDAYVDAHLFYWNVNDDLALHVQPTLVPQSPAPMGSAFALQVSLNF